MKKTLTIITLLLSLSLFSLVTTNLTHAQSYDIPGVTDVSTTSTEYSLGADSTEETTDTTDSTLPDERFINGVAVGASVGFILGGIIIWFFKK